MTSWHAACPRSAPTCARTPARIRRCCRKARDPEQDAEERALIVKYVFKDGPKAPACREPADLGRLVGQAAEFPELRPIEAPSP